jgi:hypothetical protein
MDTSLLTLFGGASAIEFVESGKARKKMKPCGRWACGSAARLGCCVVDNEDEGEGVGVGVGVGEGYSQGDE